jgi:hypothetical protein
MAREVKELPVLEGRAARDFYKQWAKAKDDTSKEEAQKSFRESVAFFKEQERLHPRTSW